MMAGSFSGLLSLMRAYMCDTQTSLSQYVFLANNKHKLVKEFLDAIERGAVTKSHAQIISFLSNLLSDLDEHLLIKFGEVFDSTYECSLKYFENRSISPPRMTLKVILQADKLVTLFKLPETYVYETDVGISENTAFDCIANGADQYICNNIPKAVVDGSYRNPRINTDRAKELIAKIEYNKSDDEYDSTWAKAWKCIQLAESNETIDSPAETCYKSTVVLPISLATEKLAPEFTARFKISNESERALFGFLCLDHPTINFFKEDVDANFVSIIADMLSLYLINQLIYTQFSSVYYKAQLISSEIVRVT